MPVVIIVNNVGLCGKKRIPSRGTTTNMLASHTRACSRRLTHASVRRISALSNESGLLSDA